MMYQLDTDIADGAGNCRHFREQLVSERSGQQLDDGAKHVTDAHTDARQ